MAQEAFTPNSEATPSPSFWGGYHWARTSNPFNVNLQSNLTSSWTHGVQRLDRVVGAQHDDHWQFDFVDRQA